MNQEAIEKLERLAKLKEQGVLTATEFDEQKKAILGTASVVNAEVTPRPPIIEPVEPVEPVLTPGSPKWGKWLLIGFVGVMVIGFINMCSENQEAVNSGESTLSASIDTSSGIVASPVTPVEPVENWSYSEEVDKMGTKRYLAALVSPDILDFKFPYNGGSTATLFIQTKGRETYLVLKVSKGQFITNAATGGSARIKFDDGPAKTYYTSGPADYSSDVIYFDSANTLIAKMKKAKKMIIEIEFYQEGSPQIEFNVSGLKWNH